VAKAISTVGMTPFEVTIEQSVAPMVRFVRAMSRTGAKVSSSQRGAGMGSALTFIVWLNPMRIAMFKAFCDPQDFQFISSTAIKVDGTVDPLKIPVP
jgi:hypothetical protein